MRDAGREKANITAIGESIEIAFYIESEQPNQYVTWNHVYGVYQTARRTTNGFGHKKSVWVKVGVFFQFMKGVTTEDYWQD